ncbi:MAG: copper amine oxidase [Gammaproteobacteria bacterium]|nr:MAG: copper amine oxidase [Gammaproteobacteria bacterium]
MIRATRFRQAAMAFAVLAAAACTPATEAPTVTVYRSAQCGCCGKWAAQLRAAGLRVVEVYRDDLAAVKDRLGVPGGVRSCHTAVLDGHVIEGHVPIELVLALARDGAPYLGLAVPGMPRGSPGMEHPEPVRYTVYAFAQDGRVRVHSEHQGRSAAERGEAER